MRKTLLLLVLPLLLSACSYRITRTYPAHVHKNTVSATRPYLVKQLNFIGLHARLLGMVKLTDTGLTVNCSEFRALEVLGQEATMLGANVINITQEVQPGYGSTCYQCIAELYEVDLNDKAMEIIRRGRRVVLTYTERSRLSREDFEEDLPDTLGHPYEVWTTILLGSGRSFWTGAYRDFTAQAIFFPDVARVTPSYLNPAHIDHLNGVFDLSQIYARKLEDHLNIGLGRTPSKDQVQLILTAYIDELYEEIKAYMQETDYGRNAEAQRKWNEKIRLGLAQMGTGF